MASIVGIIWSLALIAIVGAGLGNAIGAHRLQDWFARAAVTSVVSAMLVPIVGRVLGGVLAAVSSAWQPVAGALSRLAIIAFIVGNVALSVWVIRRRLTRKAGDSGEELERVRGRRRSRINLPHHEEEP